jgi:hypothetical protein
LAEPVWSGARATSGLAALLVALAASADFFAFITLLASHFPCFIWSLSDFSSKLANELMAMQLMILSNLFELLTVNSVEKDGVVEKGGVVCCLSVVGVVLCCQIWLLTLRFYRRHPPAPGITPVRTGYL